MAKTKGAPRQATVGKLPSKQEILDFLETANVKTGKREIARAFGVKGGDRVALKELLRSMADDGLIAGSRRKLVRPGALPPVTVIEIVSRDKDGEFVARPATWDEEYGRPAPHPHGREQARYGPRRRYRRPRARAHHPSRRRRRLPLSGAHDQEASPRRRNRLLGIFRSLPGGTGVIDPIDRKQLKEWPVARGGTNDAENGELVRFELARGGRAGVQTARVTERLGNPQAQQMTSLIAVHAHGIPDTFPDAVLAEADAAKEPELSRREDLRHLPLITIDPSDARDHDDAVWAEADPDPEEQRRLGGDRRHRRRRLLCQAGQGSRQGSAQARQLGLFPRPRGADAA